MAVVPLRPSKAPNLLVAPIEYRQQYHDQMNNALRLYFNQVDNFTQNVTVPSSGNTVNIPTENLQVGQFYFNTDLGYSYLLEWCTVGKCPWISICILNRCKNNRKSWYCNGYNCLTT
jgi:hypothetical protein